MQDKKYYSISEVTKLLNIHSHQLRYLERMLPNLAIHKIRNRRYYTSQDIEYLKIHMANKSVPLELEQPADLLDNQINKIDYLIKNFYDLSLTIQQILSKVGNNITLN
ncbi:MerR family transcriptional regulator [Rickettsia endosymbiont of Oedothorax gibbosus]|uniref:MerR family transcriptional regulator n=1 Tax=Rickettsia endosymbiont of Oedothorax gibbosus TaxID=931099 RepID=UPI002025A8CF|nr:MerR family transcriptional regulator [Rickettsia endosymbiont of Oedothorax gibbosus]